MTKRNILNRVQEHYDYLLEKGYDVVCTILQGSQNYELDEYTEDYTSDIDTKSIVLPSLEDFIKNKPPVSTVIILDNDEHAEVKDIRVMFEMFKKMNLSYIELLYSRYVVINPRYKELIRELWGHRETIAAINRNQFLKCISGMAMEKRKALCHPYPGIIEKIEKYGYDGKQLSHCARLLIFINDFINGKPLEKCYIPANMYKQTLINYKKELDEDGNPLSKERAIKLCDQYEKDVKRLKDFNVTAEDKINQEGIDILNRIKYNLIKSKIRREILIEDGIEA